MEIEKLQDECLANYPILPGNKCMDKEGRICWVDRLFFFGHVINTPNNFCVLSKKKDDILYKRSEQVLNDGFTKINK